MSYPDSPRPNTYLPHVCQNCKKNGKEVEECRVRVYRFNVFGRKCPREREGTNEERGSSTG